MNGYMDESLYLAFDNFVEALLRRFAFFCAHQQINLAHTCTRAQHFLDETLAEEAGGARDKY